MGGSTGTGTPGVDSAVRSVVVHSSGAVCTRRVRLDLPPHEGAATVRVRGLPPTLFEHALRARVVSGPPGLRVTDVRLDVGATLRRGDDLPGLRLDLEDAEDRQSRLRDRRDRLKTEIEEVAGLRAEPPVPRRGDPPRWAPVESILALAGFVDSRLAVLHERLRGAEEELARADHDVDVLRHRLGEASTALNTDRAEPSVTAVLALALDGARDGSGWGDANGSGDASGSGRPSRSGDASGSGDAGGWADPSGPGEGGGSADPTAPAGHSEPLPGHGDRLEHAGRTAAATDDSTGDDAETAAVEVELEYHVPGATWVPVYQLRLDGRSGVGTLVLRACVAQRTGEDWTGVRLGLSSADLLRRADLPELHSLRIGRSQEQPRSQSWREPPAGREELFAGYDAAVGLRTPRPSPGVRPAAYGMPAGGSPFPPPAPAGGAPVDAAGYAGASADGLGYGGASVDPYGYGGTFGASVPAGAPPAARPDAEAAPSQPAAASAPAPHVLRARQAGPNRAAAAPGGPPPAVPPHALPPHAVPPEAAAPSADMLDYARLTMTGPDAAEGRGTLRPGSTGTHALVEEYRRRADTVTRLARPAHAADVRVSAGSFDYRFDTAAAADVEADGLWHTVPVSEVPVRTEFEYVCVPSVDQSVFGTVLVTNTSSHALLAGPVDVMVDGDFVRTAALPTLAPGQRQAVGVGVAESVQVARRTRMREFTAGLRGGTTVLDHTVEVEVANRLPYPVVLEVRERVPVSNDKDVRVEEHPAQPPWEEPGGPLGGQEDSYVRGARVWRVALEAGRTTTLTGGFDIRLPAGKAVVDGNRRN